LFISLAATCPAKIPFTNNTHVRFSQQLTFEVARCREELLLGLSSLPSDQINGFFWRRCLRYSKQSGGHACARLTAPSSSSMTDICQVSLSQACQTTDEYLRELPLGALVVAHSLKDAGTTKKLAVLVCDVSIDAMDALRV
jgi:hypothetical protein